MHSERSPLAERHSDRKRDQASGEGSILDAGVPPELSDLPFEDREIGQIRIATNEASDSAARLLGHPGLDLIEIDFSEYEIRRPTLERGYCESRKFQRRFDLKLVCLVLKHGLSI